MAIVTGPANKAYLFGGVCDVEDEESIESQCMNDFYLLETDKGVWRQLELRQEVRKSVFVIEFVMKGLRQWSSIGWSLRASELDFGDNFEYPS